MDVGGHADLRRGQVDGFGRVAEEAFGARLKEIVVATKVPW